MINLKDYKKYSAPFLRISLALLFLWFGISQLVNPESFVGYVPQWIAPHSVTIVHHHPLEFMHNITLPSVHLTIILNGLLELILGSLLLVGLFVRLSSFILFIHLFLIALSLGYNDLMIRDLALSFSLFSLFLNGYDRFSLDYIRLRSKDV